jgi:hypothetical protein
VVGERASGELVTSTPACFDRFADAMTSIGADLGGADDADPSVLEAADQIGVTAFAIGIHFDGAGWSGSSITVTGTACRGGWLNLSSSWINRISSTWNGCPAIRHYDGYNLGGPSEITTGVGGNLTSMNNRANSVKYGT